MAIRLTAAKNVLGGAAIALATLLSSARSAHAQTAAPPPLVAPHAIDAGDVPYPKGASTEATVIVELLIDTSGNVQDTHIVDGADPFAQAVQAAARDWKFEPAKRGDVNVSARVRMRVFFRPPQIESPSPTSPNPTPPKPKSKSLDKNRPIDEVLVEGHHEEAGEISIGASEVRQIPGAFGDAFRAIDTFPGVTPIASGLPFFFVRGAPPGDTGYFLDGIRLPLLFHVGVGPSVVQPGLIDRLDFFPANFPAQYGRVTGGVVAGTTTAPPTEAHGEGNLRLFDAGGFVETPFAKGQGTVMIGGRYSYTGLLLPYFAPGTRLDYWDYQSRVTWKVDDRDTVSAFILGSHDYLAQDKDDGGVEKLDQILGTDFHRLDLRWDRTTSSHAHLRVATTLGIDSSGDSSGGTNNKLVGFRTEYENRISADLKLRLGSDIEWDHYEVHDDTPNTLPPGLDPTSIYVPRNDVTGGIRGDVVWKILPRVEIVPGLRADVFTSRRVTYPAPTGGFDTFATIHVDHATAVPALDPRISVQVEITKHVSYFSAVGLAHQVPSFLATFPAINIGSLDQGLQTSLQTSQGIDVKLPFDVNMRATAFYSNYFGLTDATASCPGVDLSNPQSATNPCIRDRVDGRAFGAELLVRRSFAKRLSGWLSYTLSRSTRDARDPFNPKATFEIPSEYDRTHVLTVAAAYDLGKRWRAGARFYYYTGRPYSPSINGNPVLPYDSERLPNFWRIDLRLEKSWRIGKNGQIAFVFEGLNVTLNKEAIDIDCPPNNGTTTSSALGSLTTKRDQCPYEEIGPVTIPSIGLEGSF